MIDIVREIKENILVREILGIYGFEADRGGRLCCPLHREKTPSFFINRNGKAWKCYGCSEGGTVIDFVMQFEKLSFSAAVWKICALFPDRLGTVTASKAEIEAERKARFERRKKENAAQAEKRKLENDYYKAVDELCAAEDVLKREKPHSFDDMSAEYEKALSDIPKLKYAAEAAERRLLKCGRS